MRGQTEIVDDVELLRPDGTLTREGWARLPFWRYRRAAVKAPFWRIKEWDYYWLRSERDDSFICLTFSDLGYAGLYAIACVDLAAGTVAQVDEIAPFTRHRTGLAEECDAAGTVRFAGKKLSLEFGRGGAARRLRFSAPDLAVAGGTGLEGAVELAQPAGLERMCIATSWAENRRAFYYNQKLACMGASGSARMGGRELRFSPEAGWGGLDWGRGRWTRENRWYWSSAMGTLGGKRFGFNLGYGFSDRSSAGEDAVFLDGRIHKLGRVRFEFDQNRLLEPWRMTSDDGSFEAEFRPVVDRASRADLKLVVSDQHQVFGRFSGRARLEDGSFAEFSELAGFAEDVYNKW
ncbi:MAG TPA: DUF2804 domain-containing protein [Spirochaetales bacterium]|nr:DUF2804 domain-containing protein [Spirochaetales bacterium]